MQYTNIKSLIQSALLVPLVACTSPPSSPDSAQQLLGTWRQEQEFSGPERNLPLEQRATITFSEKTYVSTYPRSGAAPLDGTWSVKDESAEGLLVSMTMKLGAKEMPMDDKRIKIISRDVIEVRNSKNGHGGLYKRAGSAAEAAGPSGSSAAANTPEVVPSSAVAATAPESVCQAAMRCCQAAVGDSSSMCGPLAKAPAATCASSLASFKKAVKASNPSRAADCEAK